MTLGIGGVDFCVGVPARMGFVDTGSRAWVCIVGTGEHHPDE